MDKRGAVTVGSPTVRDVRAVEVRALGPVAVGAIAWRYRGAVHVSAIVKATFGVVADAPMVLGAPEELGPDDLVPYRPRADVTLTGHAHAPGGRAKTVTVRLAIHRGGRALLDRSIRVDGDLTPVGT